MRGDNPGLEFWINKHNYVKRVTNLNKEKQIGSIPSTVSKVKVLGYSSYQDDEETNFQVFLSLRYFGQTAELFRKTR